MNSPNPRRHPNVIHRVSLPYGGAVHPGRYPVLAGGGVMKILSLGWGVQSFTLAAMAALGEIEPVDFAVHADTRHEFSGTYEFAKTWMPWLEDRGVKVITVYNTATELGAKNVVDIPAFTRLPDSDGQIRRQCTGDWKIAPMRRWIQANRNKEPVEQWLGISLDEFQRMRESDVKYIAHRWPLIEKRMTRHDCENWLTAHDLPTPPKSACTFCPFHNSAEWRKIKASPVDWDEAVTVDRQIRHARPPYDLFVHPSRKPLEDVDFRTAEEKGQLSLWDANNWDAECSGICGV
jgi:hypothetical protein